MTERQLNLLHNLQLHSETGFKDQNGSIATFYPYLTGFTYQTYQVDAAMERCVLCSAIHSARKTVS